MSLCACANVCVCDKTHPQNDTSQGALCLDLQSTPGLCSQGSSPRWPPSGFIPPHDIPSHGCRIFCLPVAVGGHRRCCIVDIVADATLTTSVSLSTCFPLSGGTRCGSRVCSGDVCLRGNHLSPTGTAPSHTPGNKAQGLWLLRFLASSVPRPPAPSFEASPSPWCKVAVPCGFQTVSVHAGFAIFLMDLEISGDTAAQSKGVGLPEGPCWVCGLRCGYRTLSDISCPRRGHKGVFLA